MSFYLKTPAEIKAEMERLYAQGPAYANQLLWDRDRAQRIRAAVVELAQYPDEDDLPYRESRRRAVGHTLDVGCGQEGVAGFWPGPVVGVELSEEACKKAREAHPTCEYIASPIETFRDPQNRRFDTVVAVESIEHWADASAGLSRVREHMDQEEAVDGCVFVLTTPNADSLHHRIGKKLSVHTPYCSHQHVHEYGFEELRELLEKHGFKVTRSVGVCLAPYWALEGVFGTRIRELTDNDPEIVQWLGDLGEARPELAFVQAHACVPV